MPIVNHHLGQKLRELRGDRTVYQLAKETGIDKTQLSRYEQGRIPADEVLEKLAAFYRVSYDDLKTISFDDLYPPGSRQRLLVLKWAKQADK